MSHLKEAHDKIMKVIHDYNLVGAVSLASLEGIVQIMQFHHHYTLYQDKPELSADPHSVITINMTLSPPDQFENRSLYDLREYAHRMKQTAVNFQTINSLVAESQSMLKRDIKKFTTSHQTALDKAIANAQQNDKGTADNNS